MDKYKISKTNEVNNFCMEIKTNNGILYLLKDEFGKSLKELGEPHYSILVSLMDYSVLENLNEQQNKKNY